MNELLLVITGLAMGGAENQVCNLADKLASRGYQVKIAYILQPVVVQPKSENIELIWLGGKKSPLSMLKAFINLIKLISKYQPDVVHSHMYHANILSRLAKVFTKLPRLVCTAHNTNEGGMLRMLSYRLTDFLADEFTNVSKEAVDTFEKKKAVSINRMIATHNGINTDNFIFNPISRSQIESKYKLEGKKLFIAIGRFHKQKDYPNLLNAFSDLAQKNSAIHLFIVGDGELRPSIEQMIKDKNLTDNITLLSIRKDVPELLSAADVFVLPSAWEGFGLVVAEAMACERVVVATDCGGVAEVLGEEGFLVPPKNSHALMAAMQKAISLSDEEAKAMGAAARKRILEHYSLDSVVDNWLKVYFPK